MLNDWFPGLNQHSASVYIFLSLCIAVISLIRQNWMHTTFAIYKVSLFFSPFTLTSLQIHHATVPCCFAVFGRYLPWEIGNIFLQFSIHSFSPGASLICTLTCLLICIHNFCFERPTRPKMILKKWTWRLKRIRPVK